MWTGPNVCTDIPAASAKTVAENYRRPPFVWWNWPVNDFVREKLPMGRMYGIEPFAYAGFVLNPMENLEASKVAICSAAAFLGNMRGFNSVQAWEASITRLYGERIGAAMRVFCEHNTDPRDPSKVQAKWLAGWNRLESERLEASGDLLDECLRIRAAMRVLVSDLPTEYPALWREIKNWVFMLQEQAEEGLAACKKDKAAYERAKARRAEIFAEQRKYFASLAPENDKRHCTGCLTGTRVLQPMIDDVARKTFGCDEPACRK